MTTLKPQQLMNLSDIIVGDRIRQDLGDVVGLAESIKEVGLMQPLGVDKDRNLVFGGRRYAAASLLKMIQVPVVLTDTEESMTKLRMMELEENLRRKEMTWKEEVRSIAEIHAMRQKEAFMKGEKWASRHTARLLNVSHANVAYCERISEHLKDPLHPIQKAESLIEAFRILLQLKEDEANRRLAMMTLPQAPVTDQVSAEVLEIVGSLPSETEDVGALVAEYTQDYSAPSCVACSGTGLNSKGELCPICKGANVAFQGEKVVVPLSQMFHMGDSIEWCKRQKDALIDHIVTDPPYAIEMSMLSQDTAGMNDIDRVAEEHDVEENFDLLEAFIPEAFRLLKPGGFCIMWCDAMNFRILYDISIAAGFKVQRWPLVWCKSGPAKNGSAQYNWTKKTEFAIVCRKNAENRLAMLTKQQPENYMNMGAVDKSMFPHPFAKPVELWLWQLRAIASPGQTILDPFCGSGSSCYAAASMGLRPYGIEKKDIHFMNLINVMRNGYTQWMSPKKVEFT